MKKLLVTAIGAAAAFGAFADYTNAEWFDERPRGATTVAALGSNWADDYPACTNTYEIVELTRLQGEVLNKPAPYDEGYNDPTNALSVKTTFGKPLSFNVDSTPKAIGTGLYFDSLVKFTVCEEPPTEEYPEAKIVMWLEEQCDNNGDITGTNLMVRAAHLDYDSGVQFTTNSYVCDATGFGSADFIEKWHRVTIKAVADITAGGAGVPAFVLFIDGNIVYTQAERISSDFIAANPLTEAAAEFNSNRKKALFPSLVQDPLALNNQTISAAAFDGTGFLSEVVFTDVVPDFAEDPAAPGVDVDIEGGASESFVSLVDAVEYVNGLNSGSVAFTLKKTMVLEGTLAFNSKPGVSVTLDFAGFVLTNSTANAAISNEGTLIITNSVGLGGVYCTGAGAAISVLDGTTTITAGVIDGNVTVTAPGTLSIVGGSFRQGEAILGGYIAEGKELDFNDVTGLYDVVDETITYYTVSFDTRGGSAVEAVQVEAGQLVAKPSPDPTKDGYDFLGWADEYDYEWDFDDPENVITADITLYAVWQEAAPSTYTITVAGGAHMTVAATTNAVAAGAAGEYVVNAGDSVSVTYTADAGYNIAGAATFVTNIASVAEDVSITAPTATASEYTITFDANGGSVDPATTNYTVESGVITLPTPTIVGSSFDGWTNATITAATSTFTPGVTAELGPVTLYAKWTPLGPVTPTIDPAAPAAVEVTAASEQAAIEAVAVPAPAGSGIDTPEELAAYKDLFVIEATNKGGDAWEVELTGIKEDIKTEVSEDAVDSLVAAAQSEATTVSVDVPAGLYYKVTTYNTLGGTAVDTETGLSDGTGTTAVDKPASSTQGFIKVEMSTVPFN